MNEKSFFGAMFDFSFSEFITTRIIKVLYGLAIFFCGLGVLVCIISAFRIQSFAGVLMLLVSPLLFLLYVAAARVGLELVMVIFRIAENTEHLAPGERTGAQPVADAPAEPPTA